MNTQTDIRGSRAIWLAVIVAMTPLRGASPATQTVDRSQPPHIEASAGGFTVRRLDKPITVDGRTWIAVNRIIRAKTVRAPNGQFTLTLEEASAHDLVQFRVYFAEQGRGRVELDPGEAVYTVITSDSRWILIDPIDIVDVRT